MSNVGVVARIIPEDLYFKICEKGRENAVTPFSILLTAFGKALAKYSDNSKFLLNLPVSYRPMELEGVENLVGLCSNFILFGFDDSHSIGFLEQIEDNQNKLFSSREEGMLLSGTDVLKKVKQTKKEEIIAPVVFTSTVGGLRQGEAKFKKNMTLSYTSQVWLEGLLTEVPEVLDISRWPVFDIRVSKLKDKFRIHVSMDNMILDGTAICAVLDEWNKLYKGEVLKSDIGKKTFKDYVNYLKTLELSSEYSMAQEYWNKKIVNMPPRPELPLLNKNVNGEFYRLSTVLQKEKWNVLKMLSAKYGITPSNVLLTSFSEVLYRWGKENKFTINLTINKKALLDSGYAKVLGEFTDTILVEVNAGKKRNFIEKCKSIQNELLNNLKYSSYNGVAVQRDWTKEHGFLMGTAFPIVFTSLLGTADLLDMPGKISYGLTQTPQVWLDYQVSEIAGKLYLNCAIMQIIR
nr:condensation domain-containing protein [uncultured Blautia sp.]